MCKQNQDPLDFCIGLKMISESNGDQELEIDLKANWFIGWFRFKRWQRSSDRVWNPTHVHIRMERYLNTPLEKHLKQWSNQGTQSNWAKYSCKISPREKQSICSIPFFKLIKSSTSFLWKYAIAEPCKCFVFVMVWFFFFFLVKGIHILWPESQPTCMHAHAQTWHVQSFTKGYAEHGTIGVPWVKESFGSI